MTSTGPPGYAVHEHFQVLAVIHLDDPVPLDLLDPLIHGGAVSSRRATLAFHQAMATFLSSLVKCLEKISSIASMLPERLRELYFVRYVNIAVQSPKNRFQKLHIYWGGGGAQGYNFHQPVSRLPAVYMKYIDVSANIVCLIQYSTMTN
jgi:hypothetical protein